MYKVVRYSSSHDAEVGINNMYENKYMLVSFTTSNPQWYTAVFCKMDEPIILNPTEEEWVEEETLEKNTNQSDDLDQTNS